MGRTAPTEEECHKLATLEPASFSSHRHLNNQSNLHEGVPMDILPNPSASESNELDSPPSYDMQEKQRKPQSHIKEDPDKNAIALHSARF